MTKENESKEKVNAGKGRSILEIRIKTLMHFPWNNAQKNYIMIYMEMQEPEGMYDKKNKRRQ